MKTATCGVLLGVTLVLATGCSQSAPPPTPAGLPKEIPLTRTEEKVSAKSVESQDLRKSVQADFNLDGQKDLALVTRVSDTVNEVSIYVKAPAEANVSAPGTQTEEASYYKTGTLRDSLSGKIVGIASRQRDKFTDLVLLISHTNAPTEMLQYQNDGTQFKLASPDSPPPRP